MHLTKTFAVLTTGSLLVALTGCPTQATQDRTNNQGGGSIVTAGAKIAQGNVGALTADELQIVHDKALELKPELSVPELTDEQAAAAVEFLDVNGVDTLDDVIELIEQAEENPDSVVIPESVEAALAGLINA